MASVAATVGPGRPGNGDFGANTTVTFTLTMSEAVSVDTTQGSPTLTLDDGGTAAYTGVSGNALTFTYTVADGDTSSDLQVTKFNANSAVISDTAGNAADMSAAVANPPGILQVDTTAPAITIGAIATDDTVNLAEAGASVQIAGTALGAEDGQIVVVKIVNAQNQAVDAITTEVSAGAWSVSLTSAQALADGIYTVTADVTDRAGNSAPEATHTLTVDETPPSVSIATIAGDNVLNRAEAAGATIGGSTIGVEDGQQVAITLTPVGGGVPIGFSVPVPNNTWSGALPARHHFADGTYTVTAQVFDKAGNPSAVVSQTLTVDETPPALSPASDLTLKATGPDGAAVSLLVTATDAIDGSDLVTFTEGGNAVDSVDLFSVGTHTVTASATDQAGNSASEQFTIMVQDTTPPTLSAVTGAGQIDEATGPAGAQAFFAATASDLVDGNADPVIFTEGGNTVHSGDTGSASAPTPSRRARPRTQAGIHGERDLHCHGARHDGADA